MAGFSEDYLASKDTDELITMAQEWPLEAEELEDLNAELTDRGIYLEDVYGEDDF